MFCAGASFAFFYCHIFLRSINFLLGGKDRVQFIEGNGILASHSAGALMKSKLLLLIVFLCHSAYSQWSTSTNADSVLYVCPGFEPGILSMDDGSCYVAGGLSDYLYVQKLDLKGYKLWAQPVMVFGTPGTDNLGFFTMISDGLGGLIFVWKDYRSAYVGPDDYYNNAVYMQRVDGDGNIIWKAGGIQIDSVDGGNKEATVINDGTGGAIIMLGESDFRRPGALQKEWTWIRRYDRNGVKVWDHAIDSSTIAFSIYPPGGIDRLGSYFRYGTSSGRRIINIDGASIDTLKYRPSGSLVVVTDSGAFDIKSLPDEIDSLNNKLFVARVTRLTNGWDSLWSTIFEIPDEADPNQGYGNIRNPYVSDYDGGVFFLWSFKDTLGQLRTRLQNIRSTGVQWQNYGLDIKGKSAYTIFSQENEVGVLFGDASAQKFNLDGQPVWQDSVLVFSNPSDAYFKVFASDNNGGCIIAYWTTAGGIYAQHTGRNGKLGIVTKVQDVARNSPALFELYQNYPNPFNGTTRIKYSVKVKSRIIINIYDILGRKVKTLVDKLQEKGEYLVLVDLPSAASGAYFYRLSSQGHNSIIHKMVLIK
jgi:hypothetical protein